LAGKPDLSCGADATIPSNMATNPTFSLGGDFTVNRLGFGAMRVTGQGIWGWPPDRENALKVLKRAVDLGVNLIDTADSYGPDTTSRTGKQKTFLCNAKRKSLDFCRGSQSEAAEA